MVLVWNGRRTDTPFLADFEALLHRWGTDYGSVGAHRYADDQLRDFFVPGTFGSARLDNRQDFDLEGLQRRVSSSYLPAAGHPDRGPMLDDLARLFHAHAHAGRVTFFYETGVFWGRVQDA